MTERCPTCGNTFHLWNREAVIDAIQTWEREHGEPPRQSEWKNATPTHPQHMTLHHMFGSWNAAMRAAGFTPRTRRWTTDDALAALFQWRYDHGRLPKRAEWRLACPDLTRPTAAVMDSLFGSWSEGIRQAGYPPPRPSATGNRARKRSTAGTFA